MINEVIDELEQKLKACAGKVAFLEDTCNQLGDENNRLKAQRDEIGKDYKELERQNKIMREALQKIAMDFGTDFCSDDSITAHDALNEVDKK
jgi:FtsZ-binding cell division protein ZapB